MEPGHRGDGARPGLLIAGNHLSRWTAHRTPSEELAARLQAAGYPVISCSDRQRAVDRLAHSLSTVVLRRGQYDLAILDVFSGRSLRATEVLSRVVSLLRRPLILTLHGGDLPRLAEKSPRRLRRLLGRATAVTSPSPYLARELGELATIRVLPNPVDCRRFLSAQHRDGRDPRRILWVRAFHSIYRPWDAVEILHRARRLGIEVRLTMVGPDKGDGALERVRSRIGTLQVEEHVEIVPGIEHRKIPALLASGGMFLNTTAVDNAPVSVLEAMAAGLAVITTDAGGLPDLLEDGVDALLHRVGDVAAMAASVARVSRDDGLARRLGEAARRRAEASDWSNVLPMWDDLIRSVAAGDPRSSDRTAEPAG